MAITEESRHRLHQRLEQVLGEDTLRVDVKRDVEGLRFVTELKFDHIEQTMATKQDLHDGLGSVVVTMVVTNLACWGLALATLRAL